MRGVALGWDEHGLDGWRALHYCKLAVKPTDASGRMPMRKSAASAIQTLSDLLRETRWNVFAALESASRGEARFVENVARDQLIVRDVERGWVPAQREGASLRGQVLSLFAVDCLLRVGDYHDVLLACPWCESVVFDAKLRALGACCGDRIEWQDPKNS